MATQSPQGQAPGQPNSTGFDMSAEEQKYTAIHVRLLEEESRQRVKADFREFEQITGVWIAFFVVALMGYRFTWEHQNNWKWVFDAPYFLWVVFGIVFPGFFFSRIPRMILFNEDRRERKEKTIEKNTVKVVAKLSTEDDQVDEMILQLRNAKALRIQGKE